MQSSVFQPSGIVIDIKTERIVHVLIFLLASFLGFLLSILWLIDASVSLFEGLVAFCFGVASLAAAIGMARLQRWGFYIAASCVTMFTVLLLLPSVVELRTVYAALWFMIWASALVRLANRVVPIPVATESLVDEIASRLNLDWSTHVIKQVDSLVRSGKTHEATKIFHEQTGVNWDEANFAIGNWSSNVVERKLFFLAKYLREQRAPVAAMDHT